MVPSLWEVLAGVTAVVVFQLEVVWGTAPLIIVFPMLAWNLFPLRVVPAAEPFFVVVLLFSDS